MATTSVWTCRATFTEAIDPTDIIGYGVEAIDGSIGKVDEATKSAGSGYLIVDTGPWIFGKKVILPAGVISESIPSMRRSPSTAAGTRSRTGPRERLPLRSRAYYAAGGAGYRDDF